MALSDYSTLNAFISIDLNITLTIELIGGLAEKMNV